MSELRRLVASYYDKVFVIVDAIDEYSASADCRTKIISGLFDLQNLGANVFVTSRFIPEITSKFEGGAWLEIRASDDDIRRYVDARISQAESALLRGMRAEATSGIANAADGMSVAPFWLDYATRIWLTLILFSLGFCWQSWIWMRSSPRGCLRTSEQR